MREERRKGKRLLGRARAGAALKAEQAGAEWASDELGRGRVNEKEGESGWAAKQRAKPGRGREKRAGPKEEKQFGFQNQDLSISSFQIPSQFPNKIK